MMGEGGCTGNRHAGRGIQPRTSSVDAAYFPCVTYSEKLAAIAPRLPAGKAGERLCAGLVFRRRVTRGEHCPIGIEFELCNFTRGE